MKVCALTCLVLCAPLLAADVTVDPATTLVPGLGITITDDNAWTSTTSAWNKSEWNATGNLESRAASGTSASVAGGVISGTTPITVSIPQNTAKFARLRVIVSP